jgi:hypothetical protein
MHLHYYLPLPHVSAFAGFEFPGYDTMDGIMEAWKRDVARCVIDIRGRSIASIDTVRYSQRVSRTAIASNLNLNLAHFRYQVGTHCSGPDGNWKYSCMHCFS